MIGTQISTYKNTTIKNWLSNNFPTDSYALNQKIVLSINLFKSVSFQFGFNRDYTENCYVYSSASISCPKCNLPVVKCNHPDAAGNHDIDHCNLCNNCDVSGDSQSVRVTCSSRTTPAVLSLNYNKSLSDGFIPRNVKIQYINTGGTWISL